MNRSKEFSAVMVAEVTITPAALDHKYSCRISAARMGLQRSSKPYWPLLLSRVIQRAFGGTSPSPLTAYSRHRARLPSARASSPPRLICQVSIVVLSRPANSSSSASSNWASMRARSCTSCWNWPARVVAIGISEGGTRPCSRRNCWSSRRSSTGASSNRAATACSATCRLAAASSMAAGRRCRVRCRASRGASAGAAWASSLPLSASHCTVVCRRQKLAKCDSALSGR